MRNFYILFLQEWRKWMRQSATYFIAAIFLLLMGFIFSYILWTASQATEPIDCLKLLFKMFWIPSLFAIPMLTMHALSDDQRSGVLTYLSAIPVRIQSVVLSKFSVAYFYYIILWLISLCFPLFTHSFLQKKSESLISSTTFLGGIIFLVSSSFLFIAIGIFASSLTRSAAFAGFLSFSFLLALIIGVKIFSDIRLSSCYYDICISYINAFETVDNLCDGLLDIRPLLSCFIGGSLCLMLATLILEHKIFR